MEFKHVFGIFGRYVEVCWGGLGGYLGVFLEVFGGYVEGY